MHSQIEHPAIACLMKAAFGASSPPLLPRVFYPLFSLTSHSSTLPSSVTSPASPLPAVSSSSQRSSVIASSLHLQPSLTFPSIYEDKAIMGLFVLPTVTQPCRPSQQRNISFLHFLYRDLASISTTYSRLPNVLSDLWGARLLSGI